MFYLTFFQRQKTESSEEAAEPEAAEATSTTKNVDFGNFSPPSRPASENDASISKHVRVG